MVGIRQPEQKGASILFSVIAWFSRGILRIVGGRADYRIVVLLIEVIHAHKMGSAVLTKKHEG
jgi:hypothetical protein